MCLQEAVRLFVLLVVLLVLPVVYQWISVCYQYHSLFIVLLYNIENREQTRPLALIGDHNKDDGKAHMTAMKIYDVSVVVLELEVDEAYRLVATIQVFHA